MRGHPWLALLVGVIIGVAAGLVVSAVATAEVVAPGGPAASSGPSSPSSGPQTGIWEASPTALRTQGVEAMAYFAEKADEARLWARWGPVNVCEESGQWYAHGTAGNGLYMEGGLGLAAQRYQELAGHSALLDSPLAQMRIAEVAWERGARWACPVR